MEDYSQRTAMTNSFATLAAFQREAPSRCGGCPVGTAVCMQTGSLAGKGRRPTNPDPGRLGTGGPDRVLNLIEREATYALEAVLQDIRGGLKE